MTAIRPVSPPASSPDHTVLTQVDAFLLELVADLVPETRPAHGRGRPPILPALALWGGLMLCILRGWSSQAALWRLLSTTGLWHFTPFPISDEAVYKRLAQIGPSPVAQLFADLTTVLTLRLDPHADRTLAPFAPEVFAIDQTTLDPVARLLPALRDLPPGDPQLLPGKLAGVFDVRRQLWRRVDYLSDAQQNEKLACRDLVAGLPRHSLLLFDLGYFAFEWFDDLTTDGFIWVSRLREKTSYEIRHTFYQDGETRDALIWLENTERIAPSTRFASLSFARGKPSIAI